MRRALVLLVLVTAVFWQSIAIPGHGPLLASGEETSHAVLHWQDEGHHHHDGSYHVDDSDESLHHVVADGALNTTEPWCGEVWRAHTFFPPAPVPLAEALLPDPYLHGPRRPPRLNA